MLRENRLKFVESLELQSVDFAHAGRRFAVAPTSLVPATATLKDGVPTADPAKASGFVDSGSLVSFVAGVAAQNQSDVLNSALLAQLAANKKFDRENDTQNWYSFYHNVLENVGWVVQAFQFEKYNISGATATVDKIVVDVLASIATGNEMAVVSTTLKAVQSLSDSDNRLVLYNQASHSDRSGNFQIGLCTESGGQVAMKVGAFYFSTTENATRFLWFKFSSSNSSIYKGAQSMTLDREVYGQVRQSVVDKLGDNAKKFVADLDI